MRLGGSMRRRRGGKSRKPNRPAKKSRPRRVLGRALGKGVGILALAFLMGYFTATRLLFPAPPPPRDLMEVPDVRGLPLTEARERIEGSGLVLGAPLAYRHPDVAAGEILGQSPLPGQLARPGDTLWTTTSLGPERRPVPDVLRLREDWARSMLEASGFTVTIDTLEADLPRGRVVEVIPEPGTDVALPMEVQLLVSTGPAQVRMPLLLGMEQAEAEALLDSVGLAIVGVETRFRFGRDQGRVVEQEPPADSLLEPGSEVRIVVGRRARRRGR
jgi:eukaryotic-like serine/threonine-protein kinase